MSKSRRSIIRSSLERLRQLWVRRKEMRREMRRQLGTSFEMLEPRLAMAITAPLPAVNAHIHPILSIYLDGQQVVIPTGVGINGSSLAHPHTHDYTGTIHIGEGSVVGTDPSGSAARNTTLDDIFDVWASSTLTGAAARNANARLDTDLTDGTAQVRIMDKVVDSTHVLRMYVQESGDTAPELEYDSSSSSNSIPRPELYVPRDGDKIYLVYEKNTQAVDSPSFDTISSQTVLGGAPSWLGLNGFDPTGGPLTYTVSVSNPNLLTATVQQSGTGPGGTNRSLVLNTSSTALEGGYGQMIFQLFDNLAPNTTNHIATLVNNGEFATSSTFYRISHLGDGSDFVIQGGPSDSTSTLGQFDDEFNTNLQFTVPGLLAMAKSTDDTNDSQIFVTGGPARFLDFNHSIFGVLTEGNAVRNAIQQSRTTGDGPPPQTITITSAQIITDNQNAALQLKAAEGASGTSNVTVTVTDAQGKSYSQTFAVTVAPDTANSAPFLNPIAPVTGVTGTPITVQLSAQDAENGALFFDATKPSGETVNYTINVNNTTGLVTITPPADFAGTFNISMGVRGTTTTTTADQFDLQTVLVTVTPQAPTGVDLAAVSDSGTSSTDNITDATSLDFSVSGLTVGATVKLMKGDTVLAQGVANATTMTFTVANANTALGEGVSNITATQTVNGQVSPASTALGVTYDSVNPTFTSTAPTSALVGFDLNYNAQTNEEGGTTGLTYSLTNAPSGASINSTTGVISWTPTAAQAGAQAFTVVATDAAGNTATLPVNLTVSTGKVSLTLTITKPDGSALTSLAVGQDFVLHVFAKDLRSGTDAKGVFAVYQDITFDGTKATVTGPIVYTETYSGGKSGNTDTPGLIDEVGSFAGLTELGPNVREVLSIPMRATAAGTLTFAGDDADASPAHDVLIYGQDGGIADSEIRYGSVSLTVGSTFTAVNDSGASFTVAEDTANAITINPLANDTSTGGASNTLTISAVGTTSNGGTVTRTENNTRLTYKPAANFQGTETFTYTARNQNGEEQTATISMTVTDVNDPPVATNDSLSATKNSSAITLDVLANDTLGVDAGTGETLRVTAVGTGSQGGTITIGANGANILYTPAANFSGTETFTYTISDRTTGGLTSQATVTMNVSGLTATNDTGTGFTVNEDSAATTIDVLANDALDPQVGGTLTITAVGTTDKGGTVSITQNGTRISYTPAANFQGAEKFTYTISDGQGHNATATVTMTVNNVNDNPVATNDTLTAFKDSTATFDVLANDTSGVDPTETLTISAISTAPTHGTATIVNGKVQYVPTTGYTGADSFVYTISDGNGGTATATANITVQDFQPSGLSGLVYFDVNNNGVKDAGELPIVGVTITLTGTATAGTNTAVNQTVRTLEDGSYKFENLAPGTYQIKQTQPQFVIEGKTVAGSQGGTVTLNQIAMTLAQNTTGTNNNFGELGRQLTTISLRDFFSSTSRNYAHASFDTNGAELWHSVSGSVWTGTTNTFSLMNSQSQIKLDSTNAQSQVNSRTLPTNLPVYLSGQASSNRLYYIPATGTGGSGGTPTDLDPVSVADTYSTPVGTALTVTAANGVLKNDSDPEGKTLTATVVSQPANGTLTLNSNGSFTYTPNAGFTGVNTFTYRASDGTKQGAITTVTINVGNVAPTSVADTYSATEDTVLTIAAAQGVLANDTEPEGTTMTAIVVSQPTKGTLTLASNGSFSYIPTANQNGTDTFTYKANDGTQDGNVVTVTINIAAVNDAPTAVNDTFSTPKDTVLNVTTTPNLLSNDTDVDGQTLTISTTPLTNPTKGTVTLSGNGNFVYTPTTGSTGTDTFTYQVTDGTATATGTVTINITGPVNNAPIAFGDSYNFDEDVGGTIGVENGVLANDTDADSGTTLTAINATQPAHGTVVLNTDGSFTYTPNANYHGPDSFTYQASDGTNSSNVISVNLTVNPVNDAPVGTADSYRVTPNTLLTVNAADGVLKNDTDVDSTNLTATIVSTTTNGTLTLNDNGSFTYQPNNGFTGTDSFTYVARDDASPNGQSANVTVQLVVNTAPVANNDSFTTNEDTPLTINAPGVMSNDADQNGDPLTAGIIQQPTNGTVVFNENGSFTYTPNANYTGPDSFRYQVTDGISSSTPATVSITVTSVNDAPARTAGTAATVSVEEDSANNTAVALGLADLEYGPGGGTDEASQTLVYRITNIPSFVTLFQEDGTTSVTANQTLTLAELQGLKYKTIAETSGGGTITWTVQDSGGTANGGVDLLTENLTITVGVNDRPERTAGTVAPINVLEDSTNTTAASLGLTALAYGPGGGSVEASQTLTYTITDIPAFISVFKADGTTAVTENTELTLAELQGLRFKTIADAFGNGNILWTVQDDGGTAGGGFDTLTETLAVTVGAVNDIPTRTSTAPVAISVAEDSNNATAVALGLTSLAYGPGDGSSEASQTLTYKVTNIPAFIKVFKADGTTAVNANTILTLAELQGLKYKTVDNAAGTGSLIWSVQDNGGTANGGIDTLTQTLSVTVNAINDSPVRTAGTTTAISVAEDSNNTTAVALGLSALNYGPGGGTDEASQTLTVRITAIPSTVTLFKADGITAVPVNTVLTLAELQGLKYKTVANITGTANITWSVQDNGGTASGGVDSLSQSLSIAVNPINDVPARTAGTVNSVNVSANSSNTTAVSLGLSALTYGPGGGTDEASQTLTIKLTNVPSFISLFESNGTTAVDENQVLTLAQLRGLTYKTISGSVGGDTITWTVQDSGGTASGGVDTLTENLSVTVGVNDAPLRTAGNPAAISISEDAANTTAVSLGLTALAYSPGPSDESSQTLTYRVTTIPAFVNLFKADGTTAVTANTTVTLSELQGLRYKTLANATGTGTINWTVQDNGGVASGGADTLTETLSIAVNAINDQPVRTAGSPAALSVNEDSATTPVALGFTSLVYGPGGGTDEAGQTLTYRITNIPSFISLFKADGTTAVTTNTTLTLAELQGLKYQTVAEASGVSQIIWSVQDSGGTANSGVDTLSETLAVAVLSVNDVPVRTAGTPAAIDVDEDSTNVTAVTLGLSALNYGAGGGTSESSQLLNYRITAIPAFMQLFKEDGNSPVIANDLVSLAELRNLKFKTVANAAGTGNLTWSVVDDGGTANGGVDTLAQSLSITVGAINDAPVRTEGIPSTINIGEDGANTTAVTLGLADLDYAPGGGIDENTQTLVYKIAGIPAFVNVFLADGTTPVVTDATLTLAELNGLTYKTVANASGNGHITWSVIDNGGTADGGSDTLAQSLALTVVGINDAPERTAGDVNAITVDEDHANTAAETLGLAVTWGPGGGAAEASQELTYQITVIPSYIELYKEDGTTEVLVNELLPLAELQGLKYKTIADASGTGDITWIVMDDGGTENGGVDSLTESLTITVNPVNDAPVGEADSFSVAQDGTLSVGLGESILVNDSDVENDPFTAVIVASTTNGILVLDPDGTFIYTPNTGYSGPDSFTYQPADDDLGNVTTVTIDVQPTMEPEGEAGSFTGNDNDAALMLLLSQDEAWDDLLNDDESWEEAVDQALAGL
jgi:VCBS repeat-containing protein